MIRFTAVKQLDGKRKDLTIASDRDVVIDGSHLTKLPGLIDIHVHFRTPGAEEKEDWESGSQAAIRGGVTTVFDMPNNTPPCVTRERLDKKIYQIEQQLKRCDIPLRYGLYLGASRDKLGEVEKCRTAAVGLKVFMGSSTGGLLMDDAESLNRAFALAADHDMLVAVHAEDEARIRQRASEHSFKQGPSVHSIVRDTEAARIAVEQAIDFAQKYGTKLHVLHVSSAAELDVIRQAKRQGVRVTAEATPHHLFLDDSSYDKWGTLVQVNPPLRSREDRAALWDAIADGTIDTIGSDHAPHQRHEKDLPYGQAPSGIAGIELLLPLLLNACQKGRLSLTDCVRLTHDNPKALFGLNSTQDAVLVDLNDERVVEDEQLQTRCGFSPYRGLHLKGWPHYTIVAHRAFQLFPEVKEIV